MMTIALNSLNDEGARDAGSLGMVYFYFYFYFTLQMIFLQIDYAYDKLTTATTTTIAPNGHHNEEDSRCRCILTQGMFFLFYNILY